MTEEPKSPYLLIDGRRLDAGNLFVPIKENNDLSVECIVEGGNPKPKLNWLLVPSSNNADVNAGVVSVPGLQISNESSVSENVAVHLFRSEAKLPKVLRAHHNSTIICLVNHVTLQNPINTSILLDVQCKYIPFSSFLLAGINAKKVGAFLNVIRVHNTHRLQGASKVIILIERN